MPTKNATMKLELITLNGVKRDADVRQVSLRSADGQISILPGHQPLVTLAESGIISVLHEGQEEPELFASFGGIIEVSPTRVRILVDEADSADEILITETEHALESAIALKAAAKTQIELAQAQVLIERHTTRLKVAGFRRHHR